MADVFEVARFSTLPEGELAVALLRRHGIDAHLPDRDFATINPDLLIAIGGVRVAAPGHQVVQARDIIARVRRDEFLDPGDDQTGDWRLDAVPGKVGELDEGQVRGVLGAFKKAGAAIVLLAFLVFPVAGCFLTAAGG